MSTSRTDHIEGSASEPLDSIVAGLPGNVQQVAARKDGDRWIVSYIVTVEPKGAA